MRRATVLLVVAAALAVSGCMPHYETQTFPTSTPTTSTPTAAPSADVALPPAGGFDYQLGGAYEPPTETAIVTRDSTEAPAPGLYNICYLNGFQSQPGQADAWARLLLQGTDGPVADPGWPDEYLFDTSTGYNRDQIADAMRPLIDGCAAAGFDAVEFDNLDSFTRSGGALTAQDNLDLAAVYIADAHAAGLAVAQKNGAELVAQGAAAGFDFAVAEECGVYDECATYQATYAIVLAIEYTGSDEYRAMCDAGALPPQSVRRDYDLSTPASADYVFERCP